MASVVKWDFIRFCDQEEKDNKKQRREASNLRFVIKRRRRVVAGEGDKKAEERGAIKQFAFSMLLITVRRPQSPSPQNRTLKWETVYSILLIQSTRQRWSSCRERSSVHLLVWCVEMQCRRRAATHSEE